MKYLFWLGFLFCVPSFAIFTGTWLGSGKASDTDGFKTQCGSLKLCVTETKDNLCIKEISWSCKDAAMSWDEQNLTIKNGKLIKDTTVVGEISDKRLSFLSNAIDIPVNFELDLLPTGVMRYHEEWKGKDSLFTVDGELELH